MTCCCHFNLIYLTHKKLGGSLIMNSMDFCQSCGMPMGQTDEFYGFNVDGKKSKEYCVYCIKDGKFTADVTMEEMIDICVPHMLENNAGLTAEKAREMMRQFFPSLKRWGVR